MLTLVDISRQTFIFHEVFMSILFIGGFQISSELQEFPETTPEEMISLALAQCPDTP